MTKDVILSISGLQFDGAESTNTEPVEVITVGEYYKRNNKHYVIFHEIMEGFEGNTKNTVKITGDCIDIIKQGTVNVHMVFEKNKKNITCYNTPYGNLMIGILAKNVQITEDKESMKVQVDYSLEMNYEHLADCHIAIDIKSKNEKNFSLEQ